MKIKFLTVITSLLTAAFMITSCLDSNEVEVEYSSESSITSFSINDIETQYVDSIHYGKDTTITATVIGDDYSFVIDQTQRLIYNVDSLPVGTDISKVVVNITADTSWILITDQSSTESTDTLWTSTDSLNFENPIKFKVVAYSGAYGATYTAKINVHKQVPDSLQWSHLGNNFDSSIEAQKAVTLDDRIYVFAAQGSQVALTSTSITDGRNWTALQTLDLPDNADYASAMAWGSNLYILAANDLYASTDGNEWNKIDTSTKFNHLIANVYTGSNRKLYAIDTENHFIESTDGITWEVKEEVPSTFPTGSFSYAASPLETNTYIDRITVMGETSLATDSISTVWSKLTTEDAWGDYPVDEEAGNYCPKLEHIGMIYYNNRFYAFGGPGKSYGKDLPAFSQFYESTDQGVSWSPISQYVFFPKEFTDLYTQADGHYSFTVDRNNFLWIIWSKSGQVWRGRINKLGFDK